MLDGLVFAAHADEERGDVRVAVELAARAREVVVGVVVLAEPRLREREVVEYSLVRGREPRGALQTVNRRAVVAAEVERVAEVVEGLRVVLVRVNGVLVGVLRAFV